MLPILSFTQSTLMFKFLHFLTLDLFGNAITFSPRDEALLITRQRPKGLKVVSYPKFSIDSENSFFWWSKSPGFG